MNNTLSKQTPRADGWLYREDSAFPYQTWTPFKPGTRVEVKNTTTGVSKIALVEDLWWGYESGLEHGGVINYAREALDDRIASYIAKATESREAATSTLDRILNTRAHAQDALGEHVRLRRQILHVLKILDDADETTVTVEVSHKGASEFIAIDPEHRDQLRRLLVQVEQASRDNFIKEFVDV